MRRHSFVPSGAFRFDSCDLPNVVARAVLSKLRSVAPESPPFSDVYIGSVVVFFQERFLERVHRWLRKYPGQRVSQWPVSPSTIPIFFRRCVGEVVSGHFESLTAFFARKSDADFEVPMARLFKTIEQDALRTGNRDQRFTDAMRDLGVRVCKAAVVEGRGFIQGDFDVVMHMVLLFEGAVEGTPSWMAAMPVRARHDFLYQSFTQLGLCMAPFRASIMKGVDAVSRTFFDVLNVACVPLARWFLSLDQCEQLLWASSDMAPLYSRSGMGDMWRLWVWLVCAGDRSDRALVFFGVAANVIAIPQLVALGCRTNDSLLAGWGAALKRIDIGEVLDLAAYLCKRFPQFGPKPTEGRP